MVHISARTDDGRRVVFRHDEVRDFHDSIRPHYGYAMTIASAQGLTVDRAFLLADDRPSRETVYPAATRHREGFDVYVNRSPIVFEITDSRTEDEADMPVTDTSRAVLSNDERYGAFLDAMMIGRERARFTVDQLRNRLDENRTVATNTCQAALESASAITCSCQ